MKVFLNIIIHHHPSSSIIIHRLAWAWRSRSSPSLTRSPFGGTGFAGGTRSPFLSGVRVLLVAPDPLSFRGYGFSTFFSGTGGLAAAPLTGGAGGMQVQVLFSRSFSTSISEPSSPNSEPQKPMGLKSTLGTHVTPPLPTPPDSFLSPRTPKTPHNSPKQFPPPSSLLPLLPMSILYNVEKPLKRNCRIEKRLSKY